MNAHLSFRSPSRRPAPRRKAGYALLTVVFFAAVMLVAAAAAVPSVLTQGKREMEEELIWRGEQYARAVRLYHRKNGRFPQSLEDLSKPQIGNLHFLRKPYKEPMNQDGSWRLIYVTPTGQLIGSVKQRGLLQLPGTATAQRTPGKAVVPTGGSDEDTSAREGTRRRRQGFGSAARRSTASDLQDATPTAMIATGLTPEKGDQLEGKVFGGNIIGVASKIAKPSIRVFDGGTTYKEWEFIWDPSKDLRALGAAPAGTPPPGKAPNPQQQPRVNPLQ